MMFVNTCGKEQLSVMKTEDLKSNISGSWFQSYAVR